jgi:4-hydroxy-tetrahydrodipicolinate synthase
VNLEAACRRVPVIAGVAATSTAEACRQARKFEQIGVKGTLAMLEAYFPLGEDEVINLVGVRLRVFAASSYIRKRPA